MRCISPYLIAEHAFGCGQCMPCRVNRRRTWMHRILLEASCHGQNSFVTLTYNSESVPSDGSLRPRHLTLFLKKLRRRFDKLQLRYFAVGEYGDVGGRPHYHLGLFGFGPCESHSYLWGPEDERSRGACQCARCVGVRSTWGMGRVQVARLEVASARYLAGYITKKMTDPSDLRLEGRYPEFARMSTHPGLGALALPGVVTAVDKWRSHSETPWALTHGRVNLPLGSYLKRVLRKELGCEEEDLRDAPAALRAYEELRIMRARAVENKTSARAEFARENQGYADRLEASARKARGSL